MGKYSVTIYNDAHVNDGTGGSVHTWVELTNHDTGTTDVYSFTHDKDAGVIDAPGKFDDEKDPDYQPPSEARKDISDSKEIELTEKQYDDMKIEGEALKKTPPQYDVLPGPDSSTEEYNCTTMADKILQAGGVTELDGCVTPFDAGEKMTTDPGNMFEVFYGNQLFWQFIKNLFSQATSQSFWTPRSSDPLVLDLDGNGIDTTPIESSKSYFDMDNDGFREHVEWITGEDGLLVIDNNNNGQIDNISELFGDDELPNGFIKLKAFDSNDDNIIDANDDNFNQLQIWQDRNGNGVTDSGELLSLSEANVASISLNYDENLYSTFQYSDGNQGIAADLFFDEDHMDTIFTDGDGQGVEDSSVQDLPDLRGYGVVKNLHVAMSEDSALKGMVEDLAQETDIQSFVEKFDNMLAKWANVDSIGENRFRSSLQARKVAILENFMGSGFTMQFNGSETTQVLGAAGNLLETAYDKLRASVLASFALQTIFADKFPSTFYSVNKDGIALPYAGEELGAFLAQIMNYSTVEENYLLSGMVKSLIEVHPVTTEQVENYLTTDTLNIFQKEIHLGNAANNRMISSTQDSMLFGYSGNDTLSGNSGNDILVGGTGNDSLHGNSGDDTYRFSKGFGQDTISDYASTSNNDIIEFTDIEDSEVVITRSSNHLVIKVTGSDDRLRVNNFFSGTVDNYAIEEIHFSNGQVWDLSKIKEEIITPTEGNDTIVGYSGGETLTGLAGDDAIFGMQGDDILIGGTGNDTLSGDSGNDIYRFSRGFGQDTINNFDGNTNAIDAISFTDIASDEAVVVRYRNDLVIEIEGANDRITVTNFFNSASHNEQYAIEAIRFSDGVTWDIGHIKSIVQMSSDGNDFLYGYDGDDILEGNEGHDELHGNAGNDTLDGGSGDDMLFGGNDSDILIGGSGNDELHGNTGNDILDGGAGDDMLFGGNDSDILVGGMGNDRLTGNNGEDTYQFSQGFGNDVILNEDGQGANSIDVVDFVNISSTEVTVKRYLNNLIVQVVGEPDKLTISNYFSVGEVNATAAVNEIRFSDGIVLDVEDVKNIVLQPTAGDDRIYGYNGDDTLTGEAGRDSIHGYGGNDIIAGGDGNDILSGGGGDDLLAGGEDNDFLSGGDGSDQLLGGTGDDSLAGNSGDDFLQGGLGNDSLAGGAGNDILAGNEGRDVLVGGSGDDIYVFNRGDGKDFINDITWRDSYPTGDDTIRFGSGITSSSLLFHVDQNSNNLSIGVVDPAHPDATFEQLTDVIVIEGWYQVEKRIENIEFLETGENFALPAFIALMTTDANDVLKALVEGSRVDGGAGDDTIYGNGGDDVLDGGAGNDTYYDNAGNDTYAFGRESGKDIVWDTSGEEDTIEFISNLSPEDLLVKTSGNDITIGIKEDGWNNSIILTDFYTNSVENFVFSDGRTLSTQDMLNLMYTDGNDDVVYENDVDQRIIARGGDDTVRSGAGDDTFFGGAGNDTLMGGRGNDIYNFSIGDGQDTIIDNSTGTSWWQSSKADDTINFSAEISRDDLVIAWGGELGEQHKNDLVIGLKEDGKELSELSDRILVKDWFNNITKVESFTFANGDESLNRQTILDSVFSEQADVMDVSNSSDGHIFNSLGGDDTLTATQGHDVINGGAGNDTLTGEAGNDTISGGEGDDFLVGDTLQATTWDNDFFGESDILNGDAGQDVIHGNGGADILSGGTGADALYGGASNDTYLFNRGDGTDILFDNASYLIGEDSVDRFDHHQWQDVEKKVNAGSDTITFGEGITAADVIFYWDSARDSNGDAINRDKNIGSDDLIVALKDPNNPDATIDELSDKIVIQNWFYRPALPEVNIFADLEDYGGEGGDDYGISCDIPQNEYVNKIENFTFSDGTILNGHALLVAMSSGRDDRLEGVLDASSILVGLAGNDVLVGHDLSDELYGGAGDDRLEGGYGTNILDGGEGDDTYVLTAENTGSWDGRTSRDTITDSDGIDKVLFLNDIAREDIVFTLADGNIIIDYGLELQHQLRITDNSVERFETSDGSFISLDEVMASLTAIAMQTGQSVDALNSWQIHQNIDLKSLQYNGWHDQFVEHHGHDNWNEFTGNTENEIVTGGSGEDELLGHSGNDTLAGIADDDFLNGGNGNDTYLFKRQGQNDTILDAENPLIVSGSDDYGDYGEMYFAAAAVIGGETCEWEISANEAPSNDTLLLQGNISQSDLQAYWATDKNDWRNQNVNDLLLRVGAADNSDTWNDREENISTISTHFAARSLTINETDMASYSDKAIQQLAYQIEYGNHYITRSNSVSSVLNFLDSESRYAAYNREYRSEEDTIYIQQFYDSRYTIENITIEGENYTLSNNDIMDLMSSHNAEMIRGVDWADNSISSLAGNDAVVGGELNDTITAGIGSDLIHGRTGDDIYLFTRGDGRDVLQDGSEDFLYVTEGARSWRGRRDWYSGGEEMSHAPAASNGGYSGDISPATRATSDAGGYDQVVFATNIYVQDISFVDYNYGQGLYVGYGNLISATDDNSDNTTRNIGSGSDFHFATGYGYGSYALGQQVYADDIVLPEQYQNGSAIEEFTLNDGSWISNDAIQEGLQESRDYIYDNESYLEEIQNNDRDAKGYVDQIMLSKWQRENQDITGNEASDSISSGDGDDVVTAGGGDDIIEGGYGTDILHGGSGDDTYIYNRWDGTDTIIDASGLDSLELGNDLLLSDLVASIAYDSGDLVLGVVNEVDQLRAIDNGEEYNPDPAVLEQKIIITNFYSQEGRLECFVFSDGTTMSAMELYNHFFTSEGDDVIPGLMGDNEIFSKGGNDTITLGDGTQIVDAGDGDDTVLTGSGDDVIFTGTGADTVHSGAGNDTITTTGNNNHITAGIGDDTINGGSGDDNFHLGLGDGYDLIHDQGGLDALLIDGMAGAITPENLWVERINNDVIVKLEDGSTAFIQDWVLADNKVENIHFAGETTAIEDLLFLRARNCNLTLEEDSAVSGSIELGNAGDDVTFTVEQPAVGGAFNVDNNGSWIYTPNEDYNGSDQIVVKVHNAAGEEALSTIDLFITPVNDLPVVAASDPYLMQDVRSLTGQLAVTDIDGDTLSYSVSGAPDNGTLVVNSNGGWEYRAADGFMGEDTASVIVDDGNGGTVTTTLDFDVRVSAPVVDDYDLHLDEDGSVSDQLSVSNPIGGLLTYAILDTGNHGTFILGDDGSFSYSPIADYNGNDQVQLTVTNEYGLSSTSTISINIASVNDLPVAPSEQSYILQDIRVATGSIEGTDVDGDTLSYSVSTLPEHGSLNIDQNGNWNYEVTGAYIGDDQAVVYIDDGNGGTANTTLSFSDLVSAPSMDDINVLLAEDNSGNGSFQVSNPVGGVLSFAVVDDSDHGAFTLDDQGNWNYSPESNYNGVDLVKITVTNEYGLSATADLDLVITPVNDAPTVLHAEPYQVLGVDEVNGQVEASDVDGDLLTYTITTNAEHGSFIIDENGAWSYTPTVGLVGTDSVEITIDDGNDSQVVTSLDFLGNVYSGGDLVIDGPGPDELKLDGVSKDDLQLTRTDDDLFITVRDRGTITMRGYFSASENGVRLLDTIEGPLHLAKEEITQMAPGSCWWQRPVAFGLHGTRNLIYGTDRNDRIYGADQNDVLFGGAGYDMIKGSYGDDTLVGGTGHDYLSGQWGDDTLYGDSGNDYMRGGSGNDVLVGGDGCDIINGESGNDWLFGDNGNDFLRGNDGNDLLFGGNANDELFGDNGNDELNGGNGNDILRGGSGSDTFIFDTVPNDNTNKDRIIDFTTQQDKVMLNNSIFTSLIEEGILSETNFHATSTGVAADENDFILYNTRSGALLYDADGNGSGVAVEFARLTCKPEISSNDFVIVS